MQTTSRENSVFSSSDSLFQDVRCLRLSRGARSWAWVGAGECWCVGAKGGRGAGQREPAWLLGAAERTEARKSHRGDGRVKGSCIKPSVWCGGWDLFGEGDERIRDGAGADMERIPERV